MKKPSKQKATAPQKQATRKAVPRSRNTALRNAAPNLVASGAVVVAPIPEVVVRTPEPRAPMSVELARMLEEETWWRVVPVRGLEIDTRRSSGRLLPAKVRRTAAHRKG